MIKNQNFISPLMTGKDVLRAFDLKHFNQIPLLIEQGYLKRYYQYFKPTEKTLLLIVPEELQILDWKRLNGVNHFTARELMEIFGCEKYVVKLLVQQGFFSKAVYGFYKRTDKMDIILAEGETYICLSSESTMIEQQKDFIGDSI